MLDKVFQSENAVFRTIQTIGYIWYLHVLWLVCSLPVITMGASTTALIYSLLKLRAQEGYTTKNFFKSFRDNLKQATVLFLIYAVIGCILLLDVFMGGQTEGSIGQVIRIGALILLFPYGMSFLYVFGIQAKFYNTVKNTIFYSFILAIRHFTMTIQMAILVGVVIYLNCVFYVANYITVSLGIGFLVYFLTAYYQRIFKNYIPNDSSQAEVAAEQEEE